MYCSRWILNQVQTKFLAHHRSDNVKLRIKKRNKNPINTDKLRIKIKRKYYPNEKPTIYLTFIKSSFHFESRRKKLQMEHRLFRVFLVKIFNQFFSCFNKIFVFNFNF